MKNKFPKFLRNRFFLSIILCTLGSIGVARIANIGANLYDTANYFLIFVIWTVLILFTKKLDFLSYKKGISIFSAIFSLFLSAILVIGGQLETNSVIFWTLGTIFSIVTLACFIFIPLLPITEYFVNSRVKGNFKIQRKHKIVAFCIILVVNLIYWLALYPGIYGWDSALMAHRAINNATNSHYSVLLGELFGLIFRVSNRLFHNYTVGLALSMLIQSIFLSYVYYRIVFQITKITKKFFIYIIGICFFVLNPFLPAMTIYSTQDVLFGAFFALVFIELYNLATKKDYWKNKKRAIYFIVIAILMCLCRNNGVYALLVSTVVIAIISSKKIRIMNLAIAATPVLLCFIITGPIYDILKIDKPSTIRETLSVPSQQLARAYTINNDLLTDSEKDQIEEFYSLNDNYKNYPIMLMKADLSKSSLDGELVKKNPFKYISLWVSIGLKHPKIYTEAFLMNSLGTWYPNKYYNDARSNIPYLEFDMNTLWGERETCAYLRIDRKSKLPFIERILEIVIKENAWQNLPIISTFCSIGFYFILFVYLICIYIMKKQWRLLIPFGMVAGLYITILLAPVSIFRYCYSAIIVTPIIFCTILSKRAKKKARE